MNTIKAVHDNADLMRAAIASAVPRKRRALLGSRELVGARPKATPRQPVCSTDRGFLEDVER